MLLEYRAPFTFVLLVLCLFLGGMLMGGALVASAAKAPPELFSNNPAPRIGRGAPDDMNLCLSSDGIACQRR